jgi:hypothetical protein
LQFTGAATPTSCGSSTIGISGSPPTVIQFTGGQVAPGQTCVVTIPVQTVTGLNQNTITTYTSNPVTLTSTQAASVTAGPATWTVVRGN